MEITKDRIEENLKTIGFTKKETYSESDLVGTTESYFQTQYGTDESELWNGCLITVFENLQTQSFQPTTKIGKLAWQYLSNDALSVECDDAWDELDAIFNK